MEQYFLQIITNRVNLALSKVKTREQLELLISNLLNSVFKEDFEDIDKLYNLLKNEDNLSKEDIENLDDNILQFLKKETLIKIIKK